MSKKEVYRPDLVFGEKETELVDRIPSLMRGEPSSLAVSPRALPLQILHTEREEGHTTPARWSPPTPGREGVQQPSGSPSSGLHRRIWPRSPGREMRGTPRPPAAIRCHR
jgi:hypothetical protein